MKRRIFTILLITGLLSHLLIAQIPVGYKFDLDGRPIEGIVDPLTYDPASNLLYIHNLESFEKGYYYSMDGEKIEGFIKFENRKIWFKEKKDGNDIKIKPDEVQSFVIGADSFFVSSDFRFNDRQMNSPEYMQFVTAFDTNTFAIYYHFNKMSGMPDFEKYAMFKSDSDKSWTSLPLKRYELRKLFSGYLDESFIYYLYSVLYPSKYYSVKIDFDAVISLIKTAEYQYNYIHGKPIYFDKYWEETRDKEKATYQALITSKTDSTWTMAYFKDSVKLSEVDYRCFYPNKKYGFARFYFPNGQIRQECQYASNHLEQVKTYDINGVLKRSYRCDSVISNTSKGTAELKITYSTVIDSLGVNLIDSLNDFEVTINDTISKQKYIQHFVNKELIQSFTVINGQKVYQITDPNYSIKTKSLQGTFRSFKQGKDFDLAVADNAQGTILVALVVDPTGAVVDFKILNELHPQLNMMVANFYNFHLGPYAQHRFKFKPYKIDKEKISFEVVIPFEFGINRFYRKPTNYYYYDMFWNQQFMMQNQLQQMTPKIPMR